MERLTSKKGVCSLWHAGSPAPEPPQLLHEHCARLLGILAWFPDGARRRLSGTLSSVAKGSLPVPVCLEQNGSSNTAVHPCEIA